MIGKLQKRISFYSASTTQGQYGDTTVSYTLVKTVYAKVEPVSANQKWQAEQLSHRVSHKIVVRFGSITPSSDMRIDLNGRMLYIKSYRTLEEDLKFIEIMAGEGDPS